MYEEVAPLLAPVPPMPFVMAPLLSLRQPLAGMPQPLAPAIAAAIQVITAGYAHVDLHVSSRVIASPYLTYPIAYGGMRYGTISQALPLPANVSIITWQREFRRLAGECRNLLQFLDLIYWQSWQRGQDRSRQPVPLTARERDVLAHCFVGHARDEVAKQLQIAQTTVKTHLHNSYVKLEAHTIQEALAVGRTAGLFTYLF